MIYVQQTGPQVRDPKTKRPLPVEGKLVPESTYWLRRLKCGDVRIVTEPVTVLAQPLAPVVDSHSLQDFEES